MPLITRICWSVFHKIDTIFCLKPSLSFEYERWLCVSVVDRTNLSAGVLHLRLPFMTQLKRSVLRWINSVKKFYIHSWAFLVCLCVCYNLLMCVCRFLLKGFSRQPLKWDIFARNLFVISQMEDRNKLFCFCSPTLLSGKPSIAVFFIEILSSLSCFSSIFYQTLNDCEFTNQTIFITRSLFDSNNNNVELFLFTSNQLLLR